MNAQTRTGLLALALLAGAASLPAKAGEVTWWAPNWGEARARELVQKFQAANPGITVKIEVTVSNGLPERVLTAMRSGAGPDVIEVQHGWVNGYAQNDLVLPLDDTLQDKADYQKSALDYVTWNGKAWAVPYRIETHGIIYNKDHFKEAGLDPDKPIETWDGLVAAAKALTKSGRSGFGITGGGEVGNTIFRSLPFIWMAGGDILSADQKQVLINKPEAVKAVTFYTDFYKQGLAPKSTLENDGLSLRRLFVAGTVSAYQSGQFDLPAIAKENPKLSLGAMPIPHPEGKQTAAILGGWSYVIPKAAKNPAEAKKLIQFLSTAENQAFYTDTFPARISSLKAERFQDPMLKPFATMLPYGRPVPAHKNWVKMVQAYFDGIQRILLGEQTVQKSMDQVAEEITALL
ncbi:ABC transporter substrate-binding protein [Prosthecomicrobium sp. N25]|uniref:ABC transporter substrate-binding protein n=1 Tax=Prosthecomicrobium sp. N25 TaxID=3129254 RepID=UPI003076E0CD